MTTMGNYNHDFPRLAKQSGYFFQLYRGRVNWSQIESLNIDDIIENRNFQLLEQNLINVVNCNLEREYDLKILDQNFVKLFKLAQLGVDYLSYCELYLDRCVVLLQEQLVSVQEEYEKLKIDHQKKIEDIKKNKKKNKTQNYQCEKCEKVFISDVYLKFHDKRRHSIPNTPKSLDRSVKRCIDTSQQTDDRRKLNISTQTLPTEKEDRCESQEGEEISKIKKEHNLKMEKLESELEELKIRLKKAENTLTEKTESSHSPYNFPGPIYYPSMLPFIPSYLPQSQRAYCDINPGYQMSIPQYNQPADVKHECDLKNEEERINNVAEKPICEKPNPKVVSDTGPEEPINIPQKEPDNDKENIDPNLIAKPQPLPRRRKNQTQGIVTIHENNTLQAVPEFVGFTQEAVTSSTPVKEVQTLSESKESLISNTNERESLSIRDTIRMKRKSKSFIKKIVSRNSPRLHKFSEHLKKSLTNLYDSVSSTGKDSVKIKESECSSSPRTAANEEVNNRLREMGVDPEWSGIPEKTMKQKLKALKHRRKLLTKENPRYPVVRQSFEEKLMRSLRKRFREKKPPQVSEKNEEESVEIQSSSKIQDQKVKKLQMYDTDSETETKVSDLEENVEERRRTPSPKTILIKDLLKDSESEGEKEKEDKVEEKQFDLSVFQAGRGITKKTMEVPPKKEVKEIDELLTDSDFDDDFLENFDSQVFLSGEKWKNEKQEDGGRGKGFLFTHFGKERTESQSILKSIQGNQQRLQMNSKKKVLFANHSKEPEKNLSDSSPGNDDVWSLKSDWDKDVS